MKEQSEEQIYYKKQVGEILELLEGFGLAQQQTNIVRKKLWTVFDEIQGKVNNLKVWHDAQGLHKNI